MFSLLIRVGKDLIFWQALKVILTFVLIVFLLALLLLLAKKSKLSAFVLFLGILITGLFGSGPVSQSALDLLQTYPPLVKPEWKAANLIVVLGSGQSRWSADYVSPQIFGGTRFAEASRLYLSCKKTNAKCTVLTSGGDPSHSGEAEAVTLARSLSSLGVSENDILAETESNNTYQNAKNTLKLIEGQHFDSIILVTSGFHMKRSEICFQLNGLMVSPAPADRLQAANTVFPDAGNLYFFNLVAHEYGGIVKAYFIKLTGINL